MFGTGVGTTGCMEEFVVPGSLDVSSGIFTYSQVSELYFQLSQNPSTWFKVVIGSGK